MGWTDVFSVSLLTQRSELDFYYYYSSCLNWLILLETARIKHKGVFFLEDALCPAVYEAKQIRGYAQRLPKFLEQWL